MFFNAGRMGFRHFKMPVPVGDPGGPGDTGGFGNACFGLTGTEHVVFGFNTYSVPDQPSFAYLFDCVKATRCLGSLDDQGFNKPRNSELDCQTPTGVGMSAGEIDPNHYCSCTGSRYIDLQCWRDSIFTADGDNAIACQPIEYDPPAVICNGQLEDDDVVNDDICDGWAIGIGNPSDDQLCTYCSNGITGSQVCGISVPYQGPCMCTSPQGECSDQCNGNGCADCSGNLAYIHKPNSSCDSAQNYELSNFITNWGKGNEGSPTGATGWGASCNPTNVDGGINTFFNSGVCGTPIFDDGTNLSVSVTQLGPGITSTNQISPHQFMSVSGHACDCKKGSVYQTFFSYLTNEGASGTTFCNIFLGSLINNPCSPPISLRPDCGCTFNFVGLTYESGGCRQGNFPTSIPQNNGDAVLQGMQYSCDASYLRNIGCSHALSRYYMESFSSPSMRDKFESQTFRRIDNSFIDTCGVNPCHTSKLFQSDGDPETEAGGFDGTGCRKYDGADEDFPVIARNSGADTDVNLYYERYVLNCDAIAGTLDDVDEDGEPIFTGTYQGGGTCDLVAGITSARNARSEEAINRVGRRSEQYFDLPLSSVGTARSFFAPWVDDMIHQIATPNISSRVMKTDKNGGQDAGQGLDETAVNHLAQGPYPAYSYYSWFFGPMFDCSEVYDADMDRGADSGTALSPANHACSYKRFEGQWGPHVFGKFITHPGFIGTPNDTMTNLKNASRGYFDSWGSIRLNNFWKYNNTSVFTGGTLPKFTDTLTTGVEAFGNPNQNRKNESNSFVWGDKQLWPSGGATDGDPVWPPTYTESSDELDANSFYPNAHPLAGATSVATPIDHNPHGITAHSGLGWCSAVNRQNCSWLNPRFTVMSNWLWPGGRKDYSDKELKLLFYLSTVNLGDLDTEGQNARENFAIYDTANGVNSHRGSTGTSVEIPLAHQDHFGDPLDPDNQGGSLYVSSFGYPLDARGQMTTDDETQASPFAPLNRVFNITTYKGLNGRGRVHRGWQQPVRYRAFHREPFWETNVSGHYFKIGLSTSMQKYTPFMQMNFSTRYYNYDADWGSGYSYRRFGHYTDALQPESPNQRFQGMDRFNLNLTLPSKPEIYDSAVERGFDPERSIIPSPSLLSYYSLPIIGGYGYAGPDVLATNTTSEMLDFRGVGCGQGYLWGPFGRDIIWTNSEGVNDLANSRTFKNNDGSAVTGATFSDRWKSGEGDAHSSLHAQRMFASGSNASGGLAAQALGQTVIAPEFGTDLNHATGSSLTTQFNCNSTEWTRIRAVHCLLDISSGGIKTIPSSFVGCTAYYKSSGPPATNGSDAQSVYQFNGNGWWYRTHEQLRLGINEEGMTSGIGPMGWIRHQNGYFPEYAVGQSSLGDRMYGPSTTYGGPKSSNNLVDTGHGFLQDARQSAGNDGAILTTATPGAFASLAKNSQLNNGWTACSLSPAIIAGFQRQATESHFPEIETGFYPTIALATGAGNIDILDDTKMFDSVFAWESGNTPATTPVAVNGYFKLINQSGETLTLQVTGATASDAPSSNSMPVNLNLEPFEESLNTYGITQDLLCVTNEEIDHPYLGDCSRLNDHTLGGHKVWPSKNLVGQIRGWVHPNIRPL